MGMLKDALGPAMGAGQANNGLNGAMSKVKGMFAQKNDSSTPENWRAPSPAPLPDLDEPRTSRREQRAEDSEDEEDDLPPPYDSRREGPEPRADRRVLATPQAYDEYDPPARSPRRMGGDDRTLRPQPPFEQYGSPQGQQSWRQGLDMCPPGFGPGGYGDSYGGRRPRRDRGERRGRRDMQPGGGYGGGGYGGHGGGGRNGGRRGNRGMGGKMSMEIYGGGGGI